MTQNQSVQMPARLVISKSLVVVLVGICVVLAIVIVGALMMGVGSGSVQYIATGIILFLLMMFIAWHLFVCFRAINTLPPITVFAEGLRIDSDLGVFIAWDACTVERIAPSLTTCGGLEITSENYPAFVIPGCIVGFRAIRAAAENHESANAC